MKTALGTGCLQNRVILVTGASRGIGRCIAKAYAAEGATVILLARTLKALESLYDEIDNLGYPKPALYPFNLVNATPEDYCTLAQDIEHKLGHLDGILHNAGMLGSLTPIEHTSIEQWYQVLQLNLSSAFLLTRATLPLLKKSNHASILFTLDDVGLKARAYWGAYAVSKSALHAFMQILSDELETNTSIRVNSINPGKVQTTLRSSAYPLEHPDNLTKPENLIALYVSLMDPGSPYATGQQFSFQV